MAVAFATVWPTAAAGTMVDNDVQDRAAAYVRVIAEGEGASWYWTDDGTNTGLSMLRSDVPWVIPMVEDPFERGAFTLLGCNGPVYEPFSIASANSFDDLYFARSEHDGGTRWQVTVFNGGADVDVEARPNTIGRLIIPIVIT